MDKLNIDISDIEEMMCILKQHQKNLEKFMKPTNKAVVVSYRGQQKDLVKQTILNTIKKQEKR